MVRDRLPSERRRRRPRPGDCNPNSVYDGARGEFTAFETFKILDWLLVAACVAPFILAYIIARGHTLTWRPGEVTMIVGMVAFALILLNGIILGKPGDTGRHARSRSASCVGLLGAVLIMVGGLLRQALSRATASRPASCKDAAAYDARHPPAPTATSPWSSSA